MQTPIAVAALAALAQDTRLTVFRLLIEQGPAGLNAGAISGALGLAPATLSFHLKELASAGLVRAARDGRYVRYAADFAQMDALLAYLTRNCCRGAPCAVMSPRRPKRARQARDDSPPRPAAAPAGGIRAKARRTQARRGKPSR